MWRVVCLGLVASPAFADPSIVLPSVESVARSYPIVTPKRCVFGQIDEPAYLTQCEADAMALKKALWECYVRSPERNTVANTIRRDCVISVTAYPPHGVPGPITDPALVALRTKIWQAQHAPPEPPPEPRIFIQP